MYTLYAVQHTSFVCVCVCVCVCIDVVVKENQLYASLWGDEEEGQWCRALVINQQDSKVNERLYQDTLQVHWSQVAHYLGTW